MALHCKFGGECSGCMRCYQEDRPGCTRPEFDDTDLRHDCIRQDANSRGFRPGG